MNELVFDDARSVIVGSMLRTFAADGRPTGEVERLLVHVARTASTQDLVDVAADLAAQVLSPAAWGALCDEPWLAAELDAVAAAPAPVEVRLVVTGATPEQVRRLVDGPFEALSLVDEPGAEDAEAHEPSVGQQDAAPGPDGFDGPGVVRRCGGIGDIDDIHRSRGRRPSPASSVRARRQGESACRAARRPGSSPSGSRPSASRPGRPGSPRGASRSRLTAPAPADAGARGSCGPARGPAGGPSRPSRRRRAPGTATGPPGAARRRSAPDVLGGPVAVRGRVPRSPGGPRATGVRSRDGPAVDRRHAAGRGVGFARRGGARTMST